MSNQNLDPRQFRGALSRFATGVTIVTAKDLEGGFVGTTASSFNSVSVEPPLILWSIDNNARSLGAYEKAEYFVVNVLASDQVSLSNHFARPSDDKFAGIDYQLNEQGVPFFTGCSATFECKTRYLYAGGDHTIIVGEVMAFNDTSRNSLLFHQGSYRVSDKHPVVSNQTSKDEDKGEQGFAEEYLHYLVGRTFYQLMNKLNVMLTKQGVSELEFRLLTSLSGRENCTLAELGYYSVLTADELHAPLSALIKRDLVAVKEQVNDKFMVLTDKGNEKLIPLLAVAKANEADMLGHCNAKQAQEFKQILKETINWTR